MERLIDLDLLQVRLVLHILLRDRTTEQNIIWATDTYESYGEGYSAKEPITAALVTGENSNIIQPRIQKAISDQADRTKKRAEVFTPAWICNQMNNHCDEVYFKRRKELFNVAEGTSWTPTAQPIRFVKGRRWQAYIDSRRLEITCGEAPYLVSRYDASTGELIPFTHRIGLLDRKLRVVNENAADEAEWLKYAFRALESIYGYEYQGDNLLIARVNVLLTFMDAVQEKWQREATAAELKRAADIISWNIWQMDGLKGTVPFGSLQEANAQLTIWELLGEIIPTAGNTRPQCRIRDWRGQGKLTYNDRMTRKGNEMKFDFVIGNPPYQEENVGSNNQAKPVYNLFMDSAYKVGDVIELITPARFLSEAGATPKAWNKKMLECDKLKILEYFGDSSRVFSGVDIKGGVVITYYDNNASFEPISVFIHDNALRGIFQKVKKDHSTNVGDLVHSPDSFRFTDVMFSEHPEVIGRTDNAHAKAVASSVFERYPEIFSETDQGEGYAKVVGRKSGSRVTYFTKETYLKDQGNLTKWKVLVAGAIGTGTFGEQLSEFVVIGPHSAHTQTFVSMGEFDTEYEANALVKYLKGKFARALLGIMKTTQNNQSKVVWSKIPLQDFTLASDIDWSLSVAEIDHQLYRKYNLSEEEIRFIETHVKEMQ